MEFKWAVNEDCSGLEIKSKDARYILSLNDSNPETMSLECRTMDSSTGRHIKLENLCILLNSDLINLMANKTEFIEELRSLLASRRLVRDLQNIIK